MVKAKSTALEKPYFQKYNILGNLYYTSEYWRVYVRGKDYQVGFYFECIDWQSATSEDSDISEKYPFYMNINVLVAHPHSDFSDADRVNGEIDGILVDNLNLRLIEDAADYGVGIHCTTDLFSHIRGADEHKDEKLSPYSCFLRQFTSRTMYKGEPSERSLWDNIPWDEYEDGGQLYIHLWKTEKAWEKAADYLMQHRASGFMQTLGLFLDQPYNRAGDLRWSMLKEQIFGKEWQEEMAKPIPVTPLIRHLEVQKGDHTSYILAQEYEVGIYIAIYNSPGGTPDQTGAENIPEANALINSWKEQKISEGYTVKSEHYIDQKYHLPEGS